MRSTFVAIDRELSDIHRQTRLLAIFEAAKDIRRFIDRSEKTAASIFELADGSIDFIS